MGLPHVSGASLRRIMELQKLSLDDKIDYSECVIEKRLNDKSVVACSFGRHSMVLLHLLRGYRPDIPVVMEVTGVDYPEVLPFARRMQSEWGLNITYIYPAINFWEVKKKHGWPTPRISTGKATGHSHSPVCCYHLKENPMKKWLQSHREVDNVFLGLLASESRQRLLTFARFGTCVWEAEAFYGFPILKVNPLMPWTPEDIQEYSRLYRIPECPSYVKWKLNRLGCWSCTAHRGWEREMELFAPNTYRLAKREIGK